MARVPPRRQAKPRRGPVPTHKLPEDRFAKPTWSGVPYQRSPGRWSGSIDFAGAKHTVPTSDSPREWGERRDEKLAELRAGGGSGRALTPLHGMSVADFVGPTGHGWPWNFTRNGRRSQPETFEHHEQCIRRYLAAFGDRALKGGVTRQAAMLWANTATENQVTSAIALYNDAFQVDPTVPNPLQGLSRVRTRGRADMPDVLTPEEVELLKAMARRAHPGVYGKVLEAMVEVMATTAPRPGELWAMDWLRLRAADGEIFIKYAVKKGGRLGPPKYNQERTVVLAPSALELIQALPRLHRTLLFPSRTGAVMTQSLWTTYWYPLREAFTATLPDDHWLALRIAEQTALRDAEPDPRLRQRISNGKLDFYELRHRACTYMATPRPHGLGLAAPDIAYQVGHRDGGALVERVYIHRNAEQARARLRAAMGYAAPAHANPAT